MSGPPDRWIDIPRWDEFQHYKYRNPPWIKDGTRQLHDAAYVELPLATRGVLHGLRLLRADVNKAFPESYAKRMLVGSESDAKYWRVHLKRLNDAGSIEFSASEPLATETETETEKRSTAVAAVESTKEPTPEPSPTKRAGERFGNLDAEHLHGRAGDNGYGFEGAVIELLVACTDRDSRTERVVWGLIRKHRLAEGDLRRAIEAAKGPGVLSPTRVAVAELKQARRGR